MEGDAIRDAIELAARTLCDAVKAGNSSDATNAYRALRVAIFGVVTPADFTTPVVIGVSEPDAYSFDAMRLAASEWERTATEAHKQLEENRGRDWGAVDALVEDGVLSQILVTRHADPKVAKVVALIWRDGNPVPGVAVAESLRVALEIATRAVAKSMMPPADDVPA